MLIEIHGLSTLHERLKLPTVNENSDDTVDEKSKASYFIAADYPLVDLGVAFYRDIDTYWAAVVLEGTSEGVFKGLSERFEKNYTAAHFDDGTSFHPVHNLDGEGYIKDSKGRALISFCIPLSPKQEPVLYSRQIVMGRRGSIPRTFDRENPESFRRQAQTLQTLANIYISSIYQEYKSRHKKFKYDLTNRLTVFANL